MYNFISIVSFLLSDRLFTKKCHDHPIISYIVMYVNLIISSGFMAYWTG